MPINQRKHQNRSRISLSKRRKKTLFNILANQIKLIRAVYYPFPKSLKDTKHYLNRVYNFWLSREGIIISIESITALIFVLFLVILGLFIFVNQDLNSLNIFAPNLPGSVTYYDRTGKIVLWQDYNSVKRVPVTSNQISKYVKEATVAIEDQNFYHDYGFDIGAIIRSAVHDIIHHGQNLEGASTITEQLVKLNKGWSDPLTVNEKLEELALSVELTNEYSKSQILTAYLNIAPYGNIDYGVQAAAKDYFNVNASQLTLAQSAMLAAIPQAPTYYSPFSSPKYNPEVTVNNFSASALIGREQYVLDQMAKQHMISYSQAMAAKKVNILAEVKKLQPQYHNIIAPYFVLAAKQQILAKYGAKMLQHGAWKVDTTLSVPLQQLANNLVQKNKLNIQKNQANEEALVAEQVQTGQVVALVGGTNFYNSRSNQINYAQSNISPGSTIEPYVYATFINNPKNNAGAGSVLYDVQQPLPGYPCTNKALPKNGGNCLWDSDLRYPGPETIRYALAGSRKVPALKVGLMDGIANVQKTVSAMTGYSHAYSCYQPTVNIQTASLKQRSPCKSSAAIGQDSYLHLDQTVNGIATLGRLGQEIPQTYILSISNAANQTIYKWKQPKPKQVIQPDSAYIINNILSDPKASYLPGYCNSTNCSPISSGGYKWQHYNGWDIAISSGPSQSNTNNNVMIGWNTQYAVGAWVGDYKSKQPQTNPQVSENMTEPLARNWLEQALNMAHKNPVNWVKPKNIKNEPAFIIYSHIFLGSNEPSPNTDIYPYWYKPRANQGKTIVIDKVSGLLATSCTPADARESIFDNSAQSYSVDRFYTGINNIPTSSDNIHLCSDKTPSIIINQSTGDTCSNNQNNNQGCIINATITQGTYPLSSKKIPGSVIFTINGHIIYSTKLTNVSPQNISFSYLPSSSGNMTITGVVTDSVLYQGSDTVSFQAIYNKTPNPAPSPSINTSKSSNTTNSRLNKLTLN